MIPFHPLLARDLADQTKIAGSLAPSGSSADSSSGSDESADKNDPDLDKTASSQKNASSGTAHTSLGTESDDLAPLTEIQQRTLRRTQLLKLKAEAELERMEKSPPPDAKPSGDDKSAVKDDTKAPAAAQPKPVDPKLIKEGYQKAIDLAPQAVLHMERAVKSLKQKEPKAAYPPASLARQILEEIQKAQPRPEQQDQKQQDQNKKDEEKKKEETKAKGSTEATRATEERRAEERATEERRKRKEGPGKERPAAEKAGRAKQVRRAEVGSETTAAASLTRSDRRGIAKGAGTAARKARTRPHDEGEIVRQSSRGEGLVMRHASYAMTGVAVVALFLLAGQTRADDEPEIAVEADATEIFIGESVDYLVEIRNVKSPSPPDLSALRQISTSFPRATSHETNRRPSL